LASKDQLCGDANGAISFDVGAGSWEIFAHEVGTVPNGFSKDSVRSRMLCSWIPRILVQCQRTREPIAYLLDVPSLLVLVSLGWESSAFAYRLLLSIPSLKVTILGHRTPSKTEKATQVESWTTDLSCIMM
jgi:hypothetical protein